MRTWRPMFAFAVVGLATCLLLAHATVSSPPASAAQDEPGRGGPKTLEERVQALERAASSGGSSAQADPGNPLERIEQRLAAAEALARRPLQPADADAERIRSAVESLEASVRRIEGRVATIEHDRPPSGARSPSDDLFNLSPSVDRLAAKVNDLDYRVRRLEAVHRY